MTTGQEAYRGRDARYPALGLFDKEKRREKRERREAVKADLSEKIKPRQTFAQRQEKEERKAKREAEAAEREGRVSEQLKSVLAGDDAGEVVQLGSALLYTQGLSGIQIQIQEQLSTKEKCFTRWLAYGKHDSDFLGMPATNRDVQFGGVSVSFISDEKVTQESHFWDMVALLQQIQAPTT
jgi:hypothetical protein